MATLMNADGIIEQQINDLINEWPSLSLGPSRLDGVYEMNGPFWLNVKRDNVHIVKEYYLKIEVHDCWPRCIPDVYETSGAVDSGFSHCSGNGKLCLGIDGELARYIEAHPTLIDFVRGPVMGCLYSEAYFQRFGIYPFGERSHGVVGILSYYEEYFDVNDGQVFPLMKAACLDGYRGHLPCPCGSGYRGRDCHGPKILELVNSGSIWAVKRDFSFIVDEIRYARKRLEALGPIRGLHYDE